MPMTYRILVAVDGSPSSEAVLHEVERISVGGAAVHFLHVVPMLSRTVSATSAGVMACHDQALSYLADLRERLPDLRGLDLIRTGDPAEAILQAALEFNIDLIAMGTPGTPAETVVQRGPLPVLLRRPGSLPDHRTLRRILVPLDGSEDSLSILPTVKALALRIRAEVVFLHVRECALAPAEVRPPENPKAKLLSLADRFEKSDLAFWQTIAEGDPVEEILGHAQTLDADLIAMATAGTAATAILARADRAVLVRRPDVNPIVRPLWTLH